MVLKLDNLTEDQIIGILSAMKRTGDVEEAKRELGSKFSKSLIKAAYAKHKYRIKR